MESLVYCYCTRVSKVCTLEATYCAFDSLGNLSIVKDNTWEFAVNIADFGREIWNHDPPFRVRIVKHNTVICNPLKLLF
jgi:hypothetical protein